MDRLSGLDASFLYLETPAQLQTALERCVQSTTCDPLPADEHCRPSTS